MSRYLTRIVVRLVIFGVIFGYAWFAKQKQQTTASSPAYAPAVSHGTAPAPVTGHAREAWGRPETLPDHFARHGADFHARDPDDYAAQAAAFLQRAKAEGLPAKRDRDGSLRIYDRATDTFGAYNADGTAKTFFKPGSDSYFDRQPGEPVDLRTGR
ncbi:MAG: hypothetical protein WDN28_11195 [Chthoniobacter sp.]